MEDVTNAVRAGWALDALTGFVGATRVDTGHDAISDLIANLLHLARGRGFDAQSLNERAVNLMTIEAKEEPDGDMALVQSRFFALLPDDGE